MLSLRVLNSKTLKIINCFWQYFDSKDLKCKHVKFNNITKSNLT